MNDSRQTRAPYHAKTRPYNLRTWIKARQRRTKKQQKERFMKTVMVRCHFCDCEYDTRRYEKCYKCGATEEDLGMGQKIRRSIGNFWRWFH